MTPRTELAHELLSPTDGRLPHQKNSHPSGESLPHWDAIEFHAEAENDRIWGRNLFCKPSVAAILRGQSIHVNKCLTYQTASIR